MKVKYSKPNTTSQIQAMDAGIIRRFKAFYRKNLVKHWIKQFDEGKDIAHNINIKQTIYFIEEDGIQ